MRELVGVHPRHVEDLERVAETLEQGARAFLLRAVRGPRREDRERALDALDEQRQELEAVLVGPLQIVDRDHAPRSGHQPGEQLRERAMRALAFDAEVGGGVLRRARGREQRREHGEHARERVGVIDLVREPEVAGELGREIVDDEIEGAIRDALALVAAPPPDQRLGVACATDRLVDQRGLPRARRARDEDEPGPRRRIGDAGSDPRQLVAATDEPRGAPDHARLRLRAGQA